MVGYFLCYVAAAYISKLVLDITRGRAEQDDALVERSTKKLFRALALFCALLVVTQFANQMAW